MSQECENPQNYRRKWLRGEEQGPTSPNCVLCRCQDNSRQIAGLSNYLRGIPSQGGPGSSIKVIETSSGDWGPEAPPLPRETLLGRQCLLVASVSNCSLDSGHLGVWLHYLLAGARDPTLG